MKPNIKSTHTEVHLFVIMVAKWVISIRITIPCHMESFAIRVR